MGTAYIYKLEAQNKFYIGQSLANEYLSRLSSHIFNSYGIIYRDITKFSKEELKNIAAIVKVEGSKIRGSQNDVQQVYNNIAAIGAYNNEVNMDVYLINDTDNDGHIKFRDWWSSSTSNLKEQQLDYAEIMSINLGGVTNRVNQEAGAQNKQYFNFKQWKQVNNITVAAYHKNIHPAMNLLAKTDLTLNECSWERHFERLTQPLNYFLPLWCKKAFKNYIIPLSLTASELTQIFGPRGTGTITQKGLLLNLDISQLSNIINQKIQNWVNQINQDFNNAGHLPIKVIVQSYTQNQWTEKLKKELAAAFINRTSINTTIKLNENNTLFDLTKVDVDTLNKITLDWYPLAVSFYKNHNNLQTDVKQEVKYNYLTKLSNIYREQVAGYGGSNSSLFKSFFSITDSYIVQHWNTFYNEFMSWYAEQKNEGRLVFTPVFQPDGEIYYGIRRENWRNDSPFSGGIVTEDEKNLMLSKDNTLITIW